jgi:hypothetical protein
MSVGVAEITSVRVFLGLKYQLKQVSINSRTENVVYWITIQLPNFIYIVITFVSKTA